jgi:hypothetical protein
LKTLRSRQDAKNAKGIEENREELLELAGCLGDPR